MLPESVVTSKAIEAARYVLVFGLVSLLVELLIMFWVLRIRSPARSRPSPRPRPR
ncbi:hypothetical protein ACN28S_26055 [Cystobacter fuscus]